MVNRLHVGTIVFGALPATCLAVPAWIVFGVGVDLLLSGDWSLIPIGLFLTCWCGAGLYGALTLWAIGLGLTHEVLAHGLTAGLLAVTPLVGLYGLFALLGGGWFLLASVLAFSPAVIAWRWLGELREGPIFADERQTDVLSATNESGQQ